jgi:putative methyltransferase (TIGR04325 family)
MNLAPIALFAYNRPSFMQRILQAISRDNLAKETDLHIYIDGPKPGASDLDKEKIAQVFKIAQENDFTNKVVIQKRIENLGLARSISEGVSEVVNKYGKVIVLEDDLDISPYFLQYMNDALTTYEDKKEVLSIGACNFFASGNHIPETFFIPIPDCLGWATWADRWKLFEPDAGILLHQLTKAKLLDAFNLYGAYDFETMLKDQIGGKNNSWAIRWQAVSYIHNKLNLYPNFSLTKHLGSGPDATNASQGADFLDKVTFPEKPIKVKLQNITIDPKVMKAMLSTYRAINDQTQPHPKHMKLKYYFKKILSPMLLDVYRNFNRSQVSDQSTGHQADLTKLNESRYTPGDLYWEGNYSSWQQASAISLGYDAPTILSQVKHAILSVKTGQAVYERDSVLFDKIQYSWPLLAILLKVASENEGKLSVLDFGGSLGSTYFQNRNFLASLDTLEWSIVEQENFVACGKKDIADGALRFYFTIEECLAERKPNFLLLSGVLQCLDAPYEWLERFLNHRFPNVVLDRTAFLDRPEDRLTIQHVPASIYEASYPAWFLNRDRVITTVGESYHYVTDFDSGFTPPFRLEDGAWGYWHGLYFKLK